MERELTIITGKGRGKPGASAPHQEVKHFGNTVGVVCADALRVWEELWKELQGSVVDGHMILPDAEKGFKPKCGWPEFLEKMWLLRHYVDYAKRYSEKVTSQ